ncbi:hypothetical protein CROQUDRAFT_652618 [Cronartium quercuum f. sp. fusiforme G11]|uniref:DUF7137 domain-containing protein n=1 Tax=Cronartium quercuum f. sp. fusiforme G11 TaxID=708437 RepID=A0A9P6TFA4_9BASI|nr:hypothetical protein CROQUDRAFT_652618 [Cronartium quercuum f. sp. fusiforme G11]
MVNIRFTNSFTLISLISQAIVSPELLHPQPAQLHIRQLVNNPITAAAGAGATIGTATPTVAPATGNNNNNQATAVAISTFSAPADAPVGGLIYTQPPATAAASYYKIADNNPLTFGWNYTNVLSFGKSITLAAFCSLNKITYTIATLPATATALTWDPYDLQQTPGYPAFAVATYTMMIYDERGPTAPPVAGLMSPNSALKFAMYKPQPYTPLASWTCSTCSAAAPFSTYSPALLACAVTLVTAIAGGWFGVLAGIR